MKLSQYSRSLCVLCVWVCLCVLCGCLGGCAMQAKPAMQGQVADHQVAARQILDLASKGQLDAQKARLYIVSDGPFVIAAHEAMTVNAFAYLFDARLTIYATARLYGDFRDNALKAAGRIARAWPASQPATQPELFDDPTAVRAAAGIASNIVALQNALLGIK
jgi:hypothetical protein